jgi:hypothetical protein
MITATQALNISVNMQTVERMLFIADKGVKEAASKGHTHCILKYSKTLYSNSERLLVKQKLNKCGYYIRTELFLEDKDETLVLVWL